jgi:hypothetical protein
MSAISALASSAWRTLPAVLADARELVVPAVVLPFGASGSP